MKRVIVITILASLMACGMASAQKKAKPIKLKNDKDSISYVVGWLFGNMLNDPSIAAIKKDINSKIFHETIKSVMAGEEMEDNYEAVQYLSEYSSRAEARENTARMERGQKFLDSNAKKAGVQVTASGLQFKVEQEGNGEEFPYESSFITANVMGMTFEGHVFREVNEDEYFSGYVYDLLEGCAEGITMMTPGAKYTLYLPYELAHGEYGANWKGVKPYDVLIYEIELVAIYEHETYDGGVTFEPPVISDDDDYQDEPREAGDYLQLNLEESTSIRYREDMHDYHEEMIYAFSVGDYHYIHMESYSGDEYMVVVNDAGEKLQTVKIGHGAWNDSSTGVFEPLNKESNDKTIITICDIYDYQSGEMISEVYTLSNDGTMERIGVIPVEIADDSYYYGNGELVNSMLIDNISSGLRFNFSNKVLKYTVDNESIHFPGEDIYYDYNYTDGSFKAGGAALNLTFFKRQTLKRIVHGVNPEQIDILAMGDLDADGDVDVLYTRNDDSKIYINLCKDYKIVKKLALSIDSDFTVDRINADGIISRNGDIHLYMYEEDEYQERKYILKNDKLVETDESKSSYQRRTKSYY